MCSHEEDAFEHNIAVRIRLFRVEARINIPSYDGSINTEILDSWMDQLETYFDLYGYNNDDRVMFL